MIGRTDAKIAEHAGRCTAYAAISAFSNDKCEVKWGSHLKKRQFQMIGNKRQFSTLRAFTLVELLVVIGIIALLVALLLPSLNKARRQASAIQCASNMKQIAMALLQYHLDNNGHLIIGQIDDYESTANGKVYPDGFGWAAELTQLNY